MKNEYENQIIQLLKKHSKSGYKWFNNLNTNQLEVAMYNQNSNFQFHLDTLLYFQEGKIGYTTLDDTLLKHVDNMGLGSPEYFVAIRAITSIGLEDRENFYLNLDEKFRGFQKEITFHGKFPGMLTPQGQIFGNFMEISIPSDFVNERDADYIQIKEAFQKLINYYRTH
ncbi:MAG: hypothetical protein QM763_16485 [Agriterribacter sp.]